MYRSYVQLGKINQCTVARTTVEKVKIESQSYALELKAISECN